MSRLILLFTTTTNLSYWDGRRKNADLWRMIPIRRNFKDATVDKLYQTACSFCIVKWAQRRTLIIIVRLKIDREFSKCLHISHFRLTKWFSKLLGQLLGIIDALCFHFHSNFSFLKYRQMISVSVCTVKLSVSCTNSYLIYLNS